MTGEERRCQILNDIRSAKSPISGRALARKYFVSRQVIVQDIALLRAANYDIFSTNKGYMIHTSMVVSRVICVCHTDEQIEDELNTIVDMGGRVLDVYIEHEMYGFLRAVLSINSRRNVRDFVDGIERGDSSPLKNLTYGKHFHTIEADNEDILDLIEEELRNKNYISS